MKKAKPKNDPVSRFAFHVQTSITNCRAILEHLENHYGESPDAINWGHVGSAEHVSELLQQICEFIGISVEKPNNG